ncbi:hypothetical protein M3Y95_00239200 [Aphelenchoides besseyi]|nr:hypothetical protein M3Y95_00239200 [Aphelenchoides besseyi]
MVFITDGESLSFIESQSQSKTTVNSVKKVSTRLLLWILVGLACTVFLYAGVHQKPVNPITDSTTETPKLRRELSGTRVHNPRIAIGCDRFELLKNTSWFESNTVDQLLKLCSLSLLKGLPESKDLQESLRKNGKTEQPIHPWIFARGEFLKFIDGKTVESLQNLTNVAINELAKTVNFGATAFSPSSERIKSQLVALSTGQCSVMELQDLDKYDLAFQEKCDLVAQMNETDQFAESNIRNQLLRVLSVAEKQAAVNRLDFHDDDVFIHVAILWQYEQIDKRELCREISDCTARKKRETDNEDDDQPVVAVKRQQSRKKQALAKINAEGISGLTRTKICEGCAPDPCTCGQETAVDDKNHDSDGNSNIARTSANPLTVEQIKSVLPCAMSGPSLPANSYRDCEEKTLELLRDHFKVEHLSECPNKELFKFPMPGIVYGATNRFVVPLKVRAHPESKDIVVYFVVDSGAPVTSFGEKTAEKLFGNKKPETAIIQDIPVSCTSSGMIHKAFQNVNFLGSNFLLDSNIAIIISPHSYDDISGPNRVFYLAPFSLISQVQTLAAYRQQSVDVTKKLEVRVVNERSRSLPTGNEQKVVEKAFPPLEKSDDSRPSTSLTSSSDTQMPSQHGSSMDLS